MSQHFLPPRGGPGFVVQDDGRINVDGLGVITRSWNTNVDKWRSLITQASSKQGVPEAWIAGVMLQESGGQQSALSPAGAIGLMQVMISTPPQMYGEHPSREQLYEPSYNVQMGARIIRTLADKQKWNPVNVLSIYNSGGTREYTGRWCAHADMWGLDTNCDYVPQCVRGINAAIDHGFSGTGATASESSSGALAVAAAFVAPFAAWWWWKHKR
jgi:hypothetical protein